MRDDILPAVDSFRHSLSRRLPPGVRLLTRSLARRLVTLESFANLGQRLVPGKGLGEEGDIEISQPVLRQHLSGVGRHEQDALVRPLLPDSARQRDAIQPRHDHIDDEEVYTTPGEVHGPQGFFPVLGLKDTVACLTEDTIRHPASKRLVIDYEQSSGGTWKRGRQGETSSSRGTRTALLP
jgi:hypothetical protein